MTDAVRIVAAVAVLTAVALCVAVQAQTPEIDALRARAEAGGTEAQNNLGVMYGTGAGVPQDYVQADMWFNLAVAQSSGEDRDWRVRNRDIIAAKMTAEQIAKSLKRQGCVPRRLITDKLRSYPAACRTVIPSVVHVTD